MVPVTKQRLVKLRLAAEPVQIEELREMKKAAAVHRGYLRALPPDPPLRPRRHGMSDHQVSKLHGKKLRF